MVPPNRILPSLHCGSCAKKAQVQEKGYGEADAGSDRISMHMKDPSPLVASPLHSKPSHPSHLHHWLTCSGGQPVVQQWAWEGAGLVLWQCATHRAATACFTAAF